MAEEALKYRGRSLVAAWCVALCLMVMPFIKDFSLEYAHYAQGILLQIALIALLLIWTAPGRQEIPSWRPGIPELLLALYGFSLCIASIFAPNQHIAWATLPSVLVPILWAVLIAQIYPTPGRIRLLSRAIFFAGVLASLYAFYYAFLGVNPARDTMAFSFAGMAKALREGRFIEYYFGSADQPNRVFKPDAVEWVLGHRNFLSCFILPAPVLAGMELIKKLFKAKSGPLGLPWYVTIPGAALCVATMILCNSIGGVLGLVVGVGIMLLLPLKGKWRVTLFAGALLVLVGLVCLCYANESRLASKEKFQRWFLWKGAVHMASERPLIGWGPGNFTLYFADYKPTLPMKYGILTSITLHPHNELLMLLAESGIIGLALYVAALGFCVWRVIKVSNEAEDPSRKYALWSLVVLFGAMAAYSLINIDLRYWAPGAIYWAIVGIMLSVSAKRITPARQTQTGPSLTQFGAFLAALGFSTGLIAWHVIPGYRAERMISGDFSDAKDYHQRVRLCRDSREQSRYVSDYLMSFQNELEAELSGNDIDGAIHTLEQLHKVSPGYGQMRQTLAKLYYRRLRIRMQKGQFDVSADPDAKRAIEICDEALRQNPYNAYALTTSAHVTEARILMLMDPVKNLPLAVEHAEKAVEYDPDNPDDRLLLAWLLMDSNKRNDAAAQFDAARANLELRDAQDLDEDVEVLERLYSVMPDYDDLLNTVAKFHYLRFSSRSNKRAYDPDAMRADQLCELAVQKNPRDDAARTTYARVLMLVGSLQDAMKQARLAIEANPDNVEARLALTGILIEIGEVARADEELSQLNSALERKEAGDQAVQDSRKRAHLEQENATLRSRMERLAGFARQRAARPITLPSR